MYPPPAIVLTEWKAVQLLIHAKLVGLDRTQLAVSQNIAKTQHSKFPKTSLFEFYGLMKNTEQLTLLILL